MASSMVHIRVEEKIKAEAEETLAAMGLTVSDVVRLLLMRIAAEKTMPFEVKLPNRASHEIMEAEPGGEVYPATGLDPLKDNLDEHEAHLVATGQMTLPKEEMDWDAFWALPLPQVSDEAVKEAIDWAKGER